MAQKLIGAAKSPRVWLAALLFAAMSAALYLVQYPLFDGAFATPFIYVLLYGVIFFIGWLYRDEKAKPRNPHIVWRVVEVLLIAGIALACAWSMYVDRYFLLGYQGLALLAVLGAVLVRKRMLRLEKFTEYASTLCILMCAAIIAATALFFAAVQPVTVQGAQRLLAEEGYGDIVYVMHIGAAPDSEYYAATEIPDNLGIFDGQGAYLLRCERGDEEYGVFVNLTRREVVQVIPLAENTVVRNAIELVLEEN